MITLFLNSIDDEFNESNISSAFEDGSFSNSYSLRIPDWILDFSPPVIQSHGVEDRKEIWNDVHAKRRYGHLNLGSSHYKKESWKQNLSLRSVSVDGINLTELLDGKTLVKYFGTSVGSQPLTSTIDRSNKFYYIEVGRIRKPITNNPDSLVEEGMRALWSANMLYYHVKFSLLPMKFCDKASMYKYVLLYTIRLPIAKDICQYISAFISDLSITYSNKFNRFCKVADHHSASMVYSGLPSVLDLTCHLVFDRKTYMDRIDDGTVKDGKASMVAEKTISSLINARRDTANYSFMSYLALVEINIKVSMLVVDLSRLNDQVYSVIRGFLGSCVLYGPDVIVKILTGEQHLRRGIPSSWSLCYRSLAQSRSSSK